MPSKALVALIALAMIGASPAAMARGGGGGGGGKSGGSHSGHMNHFHHLNQFHHRFLNDQAFFGGLGWGWGYGYGDSGYGNTTIVSFPHVTPQSADVTGAVRAASCHWAEDTFTVPASAGGTRPISVVSCR
jgi:hypothetical protein